jgi:propionyl-CoA carboxylase alpha chain
VDHCLELANKVGYPVMVKAVGGGGGKGMRIAWNDAEAREGYQLAKQGMNSRGRSVISSNPCH